LVPAEFSGDRKPGPDEAGSIATAAGDGQGAGQTVENRYKYGGSTGTVGSMAGEVARDINPVNSGAKRVKVGHYLSTGTMFSQVISMARPESPF
jgi:hypothetical protein